MLVACFFFGGCPAETVDDVAWLVGFAGFEAVGADTVGGATGAGLLTCGGGD